MSVDMYRRAKQRHQDALARLQQEKSREANRAAEDTRRANAASEMAGRSTNGAGRASKLRDAERYAAAAAQGQKRIADLEAKIAREQSGLNQADKDLRRAEEQDRRRRIQAQERAEREHERTMRAVTGRLQRHEQLHVMALSKIERLQQLPEQIVVLFLASNPLDQESLRLDEEARAVTEMIRKSEHRDSVRLESRWAVRPLDVLQAINECRPRIVHFSGHGSSQEEIVFQDDAGQTKLVKKDAIVQTMAAASSEIELVFFNTCFSRGQAEAIVQSIPAAIGMTTSIGDDAARVFAAQFYSAIGFGHSVKRAYEQAKAALMLAGIDEAGTPELFVMLGRNGDELVLVRPERAANDRSS